MDRKIVKPAQVGGKIWNPDHSSFLPPDGAEVLMTPYWLGLVHRADITAEDLPAVAEPTPDVVQPAAEAGLPDAHAAPSTEQGAVPAA